MGALLISPSGAQVGPPPASRALPEPDAGTHSAQCTGALLIPLLDRRLRRAPSTRHSRDAMYKGASFIPLMGRHVAPPRHGPSLAPLPRRAHFSKLVGGPASGFFIPLRDAPRPRARLLRSTGGTCDPSRGPPLYPLAASTHAGGRESGPSLTPARHWVCVWGGQRFCCQQIRCWQQGSTDTGGPKAPGRVYMGAPPALCVAHTGACAAAWHGPSSDISWLPLHLAQAGCCPARAGCCPARAGCLLQELAAP